MATHSSILTWSIPGTEETGRLWSMELQKVGHDWATNPSHFITLYMEMLYLPCLFIGVELLYNVQCFYNVTVTHVHTSPSFWISFPFRSPQNTEKSSLCCKLVAYFIHSNVYMSIPISQFIPPPLPLGVHVYSVYFCCANRFICTIF